MSASGPGISRESVQIGNILFTRDRLAQLDQSHTVTRIAREDFVGGEITFSRPCKHPLVLSLIAIAMIWFGLLTARGIVEWLMNGGTVYDVSIMMVLFFPGGVALLYQAWRKAPLLIIETRRGTRRIEFKGDRSKETIAALERAAREHGYALRPGPGSWQ